MKPTDSFLLAEASEYRMLQKLARDEDGFTFPTIICRRGSKVIGFAASNKHKSMLVMGRAWVDPEIKMPGLTLIRLIEAYDIVARTLLQRDYCIIMEAKGPIYPYIDRLPGMVEYEKKGKYRYIKRTIPAAVQEEAA